MAKFATPVAMKVTKEEEGIELVKSLKTLGYRYIHKRYVGYVTTAWNGEHNLVTILDYKPQYRHIIEEYNPELFLAIAAMTEWEEWIVGEYLVCRGSSKPIKVKGFREVSLREYGLKKATLEELTNHFSKPKESKEIPKEFYVKYCEGFTEDIFDQLYAWGEKNSEGPIRGHDDKYQSFETGIGPHNGPLDRFNFQKKVDERDYNSKHGYGCDNHDWCGGVKTEYTLDQVKELINYKPKTNKNEYKEDSYESESREIKQIDEDLDSISSREGGKEIKIRTVSSRNLCERGSIESSNSITSPRGSSSRLRAERGRLYI